MKWSEAVSPEANVAVGVQNCKGLELSLLACSLVILPQCQGYRRHETPGQRPRPLLLTAIAVAEDQPRFPQGEQCQVTRALAGERVAGEGPRMYVGIHVL